MTTKADFTTDEWDRLVQLPRWVVAAASAAQQDLAYRTTIEVEAGFIASANGRTTGNPFVAEVAGQTMRIFDTEATITATDVADRETGIVAVLDRVRGVNQVIKAKLTVADAMAYRRWLLDIADVVISAAKSGDFLGLGGKRVTAAEHGFRDRLVLALQG